MAHKWEPGFRGYRACAHCDVVQWRQRLWDGPRRARDKSGRARWQWFPNAGRCTSTKDDQPPKRRLAILAAIKDGRHTPIGIAAHAGIPIPTARTALSLAKKSGLVTNPRRGWWELGQVGTAPPHPQAVAGE
jgi:hypothetical protein